jgi:hypothetical protein
MTYKLSGLVRLVLVHIGLLWKQDICWELSLFYKLMHAPLTHYGQLLTSIDQSFVFVIEF